jgi:hypothetical protein
MIATARSCTVAMTRDQRDETKWHLEESVLLGDRHAESAVIRFGDGTSELALDWAP